METRVTTEEDAAALVVGLGLLATGGGGLASRGLGWLGSLREDGVEVGWVDVEDLDDEVMTCSVFGMGSIAPHPPMSSEEMAAFGVDGERQPRPWLRALERLEHHLGRPIGAVIPFELGPSNTIVALDAAARSGRLLVDGDYIGRALPKMSQALPAVLGRNVLPVTICDPWGNALLLEDCPSPAVAERIGKMVSKVTKAVDMLASCSHAGFPNRVGELGPALVRGTLSRSLGLGRAVLEARRGGDDPVEAAVATGGGCVLFRGEVVERRWDDSPEGYMEGTTVLSDGSAGAEIWFQNEHHVLWRDGEVAAASPDIITVVDTTSSEPVSNTELDVGQIVAVIGFRAPAQYRSGAAFEATHPGHYGFSDIEWAPIEELNPKGHWDL
ncbi:MAG TPA: DUF917 domain-containing protein [Acidimicrobiia bacterium]